MSNTRFRRELLVLATLLLIPVRIQAQNAQLDSEKSEAAQVLRQRQVIAQALKSASEEFDVPLSILQGIAFAQSHWKQLVPSPPPEMPRAYGVMGLHDDEYFGHGLQNAAELIGATQDELKDDPVVNIRGAAALLAEVAKAMKISRTGDDDHFRSWKKAIQVFSGMRRPLVAESFAFDVLQVARDGFRGEASTSILRAP